MAKWIDSAPFEASGEQVDAPDFGVSRRVRRERLPEPVIHTSFRPAPEPEPEREWAVNWGKVAAIFATVAGLGLWKALQAG